MFDFWYCINTSYWQCLSSAEAEPTKNYLTLVRNFGDTEGFWETGVKLAFLNSVILKVVRKQLNAPQIANQLKTTQTQI